MKILPLREDLVEILEKHQLIKKFAKQKRFFKANPRHPSLHTEKLEPRNLNLYSFRVDKQWRAIFVYQDDGTVEIIDINPHYG